MIRGLNAAAESLTLEEQLGHAAELLASAPGNLFQKAVLKLDKALRLVLDQPQVLRFRTLRLGNPIVASELLACPGARALLECAGFKHNEPSDSESGDPGCLVLPPESELAAVQAARSRLKVEAQRRVRWCTPEQLAAASARNELSLLPMPCVLGVDAGGAPLCLGRACISQGVHPGSAPLVASPTPTAAAGSATLPAGNGDSGKSQREGDGSGGGGGGVSSSNRSNRSASTGDTEPLWGVRGGGCRMGYGGRTVIVDAWNAGGRGYEVLCAHPTALELVNPNISTTTRDTANSSSSSSGGRGSGISGDGGMSCEWPVRALVAGFEADGTPLYGAVARPDLDTFAASEEGDGSGGGGGGRSSTSTGGFQLSSMFRPRIPGKTRPGLGGASCAFGGCEVTASEYTLVCLAAHAIFDDDNSEDEDGEGGKLSIEDSTTHQREIEVKGGSGGGDGIGLALRVTQPCMPRPPSRRFMLSVAELMAWKEPISSSSKNNERPLRSNQSHTKGGLDLPWASPQALTFVARPTSSNEDVPKTPPKEPQPRVLMIHDMQGGYNDTADGRYLQSFQGWASIDEFCYFSHHLVTMPPACWIEACHAHGVPCYGTLITEHNAWENHALLRTVTTQRQQPPSSSSTSSTSRSTSSSSFQATSSSSRYGYGLSAAEPDELPLPPSSDIENYEFPAAKQLAKLMAWCGFDGWLVNIEAPLPDGARDVVKLQRFLAALRYECRVAAHAAAAAEVTANTTSSSIGKAAAGTAPESGNAMTDASDESRSSTLPFTSLQHHAEEVEVEKLPSRPLPIVLIYDSVSADGRVAWCSELSACHPKTSEPHANLALFAHCDGVLLDYKWNPAALVQSRQVADALPRLDSDEKLAALKHAASADADASEESTRSEISSSRGTSTSISAPPHSMLRGSSNAPPSSDGSRPINGRRCDVYAGIDVFGRHTWYTEGATGAAEGVRAVAAAGLSLGLFAPGWVMEAGPGAQVVVAAADGDSDTSEEDARCDAAFWAEINTNCVREAS